MRDIRRDFEMSTDQEVSKLITMRHIMVQTALRLVGTNSMKYRGVHTGDNLQDGFDCSGLIKAVVDYSAEACDVNLDVPRHANEQWRYFGEMVDYGLHGAGDIVFFASRKKSDVRIIGHVGLVINESQYVHAPGKDGTLIEIKDLPEERSTYEDYHRNDIYRYDPAGVKRLSLPIGSGRWHVW